MVVVVVGEVMVDDERWILGRFSWGFIGRFATDVVFLHDSCSAQYFHIIVRAV
jgi:hypothetical protein